MRVHSRLFILAVFASLPTGLWAAKQGPNPEAEAASLGRRLKPLSNEKWQEIVGPRISESYSVTKGDTLFDISKKLFAEPKYWPKIWAINGQKITNPHQIYPGNVIAFNPGSGSDLPTLTLSDSNIGIFKPNPNAPRSLEWQGLPKQSWETFRIEMPPDVDPLGFDKRNKVVVAAPTGTEPLAVPASGLLTTLGQIVGSRSEGQYLGMNETVYIEADEKIQVGETYAIINEPEILKSRKSDRIGYSYFIIGKVQILGVRDHLYVGRIITGRDFLTRGAFLIPLPPKTPVLTPIPGPRPLAGIVMIDHRFSTYTTAQHKTVFVDRGSDDGLQPGMVFRAYQHYDPSNNKKVSNADFIIDADLIVTQVSELFCTAEVLHSLSPILEHSGVVLLTDISDLKKNQGFREKGDAHDFDELDKLDNDDPLNRQERRTLKQLEGWKKNPEPSPSPEPEPSVSPSPIPSPTPEPTPTDGASSDSATPNPTPEDAPPPPSEAAPPVPEATTPSIPPAPSVDIPPPPNLDLPPPPQ